jgi:hypothetical protein
MELCWHAAEQWEFVRVAFGINRYLQVVTLYALSTLIVFVLNIIETQD